METVDLNEVNSIQFNVFFTTLTDWVVNPTAVNSNYVGMFFFAGKISLKILLFLLKKCPNLDYF